MVKHLCCYEVSSPPRWVVAPWHMLLGIKPDRNHGYWTQRDHCGGVFDLGLCVRAWVRVWTQCEPRGVWGSFLGVWGGGGGVSTKAQQSVIVAITLIARKERKTTTSLTVLQVSLPLILFSCRLWLIVLYMFLLLLLFLEFKTSRSEKSIAGCVLCKYLSGAFSIKGRLINRLG